MVKDGTNRGGARPGAGRKPLGADEIYNKVCLWLTKLGCEKLVNPTLIEQYAMSVARWVQCEEAITRLGFLGKHSTTGNPIL